MPRRKPRSRENSLRSQDSDQEGTTVLFDLARFFLVLLGFARLLGSQESFQEQETDLPQNLR